MESDRGKPITLCSSQNSVLYLSSVSHTSDRFGQYTMRIHFQTSVGIQKYKLSGYDRIHLSLFRI